MVQKIVSFTRKFEDKLQNYLQLQDGLEIFIGLIGHTRGRDKATIEYRLTDGIPFPNLSNQPEKYVEVTQLWYELIWEYLRFHRPKSSTRILGVLHTHPSSIPQLSKQDEYFATNLAKKKGDAIMLVVGKHNIMYAYLVNSAGVQKIRHTSKQFRKKITI